MSDRSDEVTAEREPASTDELLEETERLLAGEGTGREPSDEPSARGLETSSDEPSMEAGGEPTRSSGGSRLRSFASRLAPSRLAPSKYFSPKAFLAVTLAIVAGLFAGNLAIPFGGSVGGLLGAFAVAFVLGAVTAKRRYLEVTAAGASVGAVAALLDFAITAIAVGGSGTRLVALGAAAGVVVCVGGYYFGRDLRDGLSREI